MYAVQTISYVILRQHDLFDPGEVLWLILFHPEDLPVSYTHLGWFDQKGGDFRSIHNYCRPLQVKLDGKKAFVISAYGGYACHIDGHSSVAVSYTHLDVYKRQDIDCACFYLCTICVSVFISRKGGKLFLAVLIRNCLLYTSIYPYKMNCFVFFFFVLTLANNKLV